MNILPIAFALIFAMFLTIGDGIATLNRSRYGFKLGLATWVVLVAVPGVLGLIYIKDITVYALCISAALSLLLHLQKNPRLRHIIGPDF